MCVTNSFLSYKLDASFQISKFSLFQVKMVNHCEVYVIFQDVEHELLENILHHYLYCGFL